MTEPWQLRLYKKSLKKKATVDAILSLLPNVRDKKCLEVGCATGMTSYLLRQRGGEWISVDFEQDHVESARRLVGERVFLTSDKKLEFGTGQFDVVVGINFLEHIEKDDRFISEMARVLRSGGDLVFTAPKGEKHRVGYWIKKIFGFTSDIKGFGHARDGYLPDVLKEQFRRAGLEITQLETYSRFFAESIEDILNFVYHKQASGKRGPEKGEDFHGTTSPMSEDSFSKVSLSFRMYSLVFPLIRGVTLLDYLIPFTSGYMLACRARKIA